MNAGRKIIGLLIILFLGLPALIATIWTVGLTNAVISPEFLVDFPEQVANDIPDLIEDIIEDGRDPDMISDRNLRAWFQAAAETELKPRQVMKESGITDWMETELADSLEEIRDTLQGRRPARPIVLDLRPLKRALTDESLDHYFMDLVGRFPPCNDEDIEEWQAAYRRGADLFDLPPCRPETPLLQSILNAHRMELMDDWPDDVEMFEDVHLPGLGLTRAVNLLSYGFLIIPLGLLILGAVIAGGSTGGFFRWFGISLFVGAGIALVLALLIHHFGLAALDWAAMHPAAEMDDLGRLVISKTSWFQEQFVSRLFKPVQRLAGLLCLFGVVFMIGSLAASKPSGRTG